MKDRIDYIYLPTVKLNDILNTGENISGRAIITKKYFFVLPDKITDPIGLTKRDIYDPNFVNSCLNDMEKVDSIDFDTTMLSSLPQRWIKPIANFEKFDVSVGFFIFGGLKMKSTGERTQSVYIGNTAMRKKTKEFYETHIK